MNYGLYTAASGLLVSMHRLDVSSNNLANVNTTAFKVDKAFVRQRLPERVEDGLAHIDSNALLERLGGGVLAHDTRPDLGQGPLESTGNDFDLALEGPGFFAVRHTDDAGEATIALTRDGRFTMDERGRLARATDGRIVLDRADRPVMLNPQLPFTVDGDGVVRQGDQAVTTLKIVRPIDQALLSKLGDSLFTVPIADEQLERAPARVVQGTLERSGVDAIDAMMDVTGAASAVGRNSRVLQMFDQTMDRAVNTLGRTA